MARSRIDRRLSRGAALRVGGQGTCAIYVVHYFVCNLIFCYFSWDGNGEAASWDGLVPEALRPARWVRYGLVLVIILECPYI